MKILDRYILKRYLISFFFTLLILIPIAIAIDVAEKVDKFLRNPSLTVIQIIKDYYVNFVIYYANTFMPLALFIAVIFFTSKLANNTEVIAINNAKISFLRFLVPYFIGATLVAVVALYMNHYVVPHSNKLLQEFTMMYLKKNNSNRGYVNNANIQLDINDFIHVRSYNLERNFGNDFTYEHYDGIQLKYKIIASSVRWTPSDSIFVLGNYKKRIITAENDRIESGVKMDTVFNFVPNDLLYQESLAKEMTSPGLLDYIKLSHDRGRKNLNAYFVEYYKRTSLPVSSYILTLLATSLASRKKRGGMGVNLALGVSLMFIYVFFLKVAEVLGAVAGANPLFLVWMPNIIFLVISLYFYKIAKG